MRALDAETLKKLMHDLGDDPQVIQELVDTFLQEGPRSMKEMRDALTSGDRRTLNRVAHSLKSTAGIFGAQELSRLCRELERDTEGAVPRDAPARVAAAEAEWARVAQELAGWRP